MRFLPFVFVLLTGYAVMFMFNATVNSHENRMVNDCIENITTRLTEAEKQSHPEETVRLFCNKISR